MDLVEAIEILKRQIKLLEDINDDLKESYPELVRDNIETIDSLIRTIHFVTNA